MAGRTTYNEEREGSVDLSGLGVGEVGVVHEVAAESAKAPVVARVLEDVHDRHGAVAIRQDNTAAAKEGGRGERERRLNT